MNTYVISTLHMKNVHTMTPLSHKNGDAHICVMMEVGISTQINILVDLHEHLCVCANTHM